VTFCIRLAALFLGLGIVLSSLRATAAVSRIVCEMAAQPSPTTRIDAAGSMRIPRNVTTYFAPS
jgi:hypothetical protein